MIVDGWFDWMERAPGPPNKVWPDVNAIDAVIFHSAVGSLQGVINIVQGPAEKSVTAVVGYFGRAVQFYPVRKSPWANGSREFNRRYLGFEFEGGVDTPATVSEPLTEKQTAAAVRILQDLATYKGVGWDFWQRPTTLKEHRELIATACPSNRIPWAEILRRLNAPPAPVYESGDVALACVSAAHFVRMQWSLGDLLESEKQIIRWLASQV